MSTSVPFFLVDVFADAPLTGNPLPVVADAERLQEPVMRAVAREFNQSETTFVLPPTRPEATWRLRSFTPAGAEVVGAGHNALGAWWWLATAGRIELDADGGALPAQVVSTGAAHLLVPVGDRAAVDRARPDAPRLAAALAQVGGQGCYLYCLDPVDPAAVAYARFVNPTVGIAEDPATGSAAGPLVSRLVAQGVVPDGAPAIVEQGHAIGRPSRIRVQVRGEQVRIGGSGIVVAEGTLTV